MNKNPTATHSTQFIKQMYNVQSMDWSK